jgi:hypothetical protein
MKTANIGGQASDRASPADREPAPAVPLPEAQPEPRPEPAQGAQGAQVVQFTSPYDYLYDLLAEVDRAMAALPGPNVVASELPVAHRPELVPTDPKQRRYLPPLGDGFGRIASMPEGVLVARLTADPISAAVEPTAGSSRHSRRPAWRSVPVPGTASRAPMHGQAAVHGFVPPFSIPPPPPRRPDNHRR